MPCRPDLFVVLDPEDSLERHRFVTELHSPTDGRAACEISADGRNLHRLGQDILDALGKDVEARGAGRRASTTWRQSLAWMVGERIEDLFVNRAHHLSRHRWEWLIELAAESGCRLWLIAQLAKLPRGLRETVRDWPFDVSDFDHFQRRWAAAAQRTTGRDPDSGTDQEATFPAVPESNFTTFRAVCRRTLSADDFAVVDETYRQALRGARRFFAGGNQPSRERTASWLVERLDGARSWPEAVVRLRAIQAAALLAGWLIKADANTVFVWKSQQLAINLDAESVQLLSAYAEPCLAGSAALSLLTRAGPATLAALNVSDLELEPDEIRVAGESHSLEVDLRAPLRALLADRLLDGADYAQPLLISDRDHKQNRVKPAGLRDSLRKMTMETGLPLARRLNSVKGRGSIAEARQVGLDIIKLTGAGR